LIISAGAQYIDHPLTAPLGVKEKPQWMFKGHPRRDNVLQQDTSKSGLTRTKKAAVTTYSPCP
jgi:hypothetical protein